MKQYGPNSGVNRIKVTGPDFDTIRERILSAPDVIADQVLAVFDEVGSEAVDEMKDTITNASTKTGAARVAAGGNGPGRIDTGKMIDAVSYIARKNARRVSLRFGWLYGRPGYAFFQEYGTSNGVPAMHALTNARVHADIKIKRALP